MTPFGRIWPVSDPHNTSMFFDHSLLYLDESSIVVRHLHDALKMNA